MVFTNKKERIPAIADFEDRLIGADLFVDHEKNIVSRQGRIGGANLLHNCAEFEHVQNVVSVLKLKD